MSYIGAPAIDRGSRLGGGVTYLNLTGPASEDGPVTEVEIFVETAIGANELKIGTFFFVEGTTYECRDSVAIASSFSTGYHKITGLSIEAKVGDLIGYGLFASSGWIDRDTSGFSGILWATGDFFTPAAQASYGTYSGDCISLYGLVVGAVLEASTQAVSDISYFSATGNGTIVSVGSEDCTKRGFVYSTSAHEDPGNTAPAVSDYESYTEEEGTFEAGAFTGSLTSLDPETMYYVRAWAYNPTDGYTYGEEVNFTTDIAHPTVTTQAATSVQVTTATGNGNITVKGSENADKRGFVYGTATKSQPDQNTAPESSGYDSYTQETGSFDTGAYTAGITSLTGGTLYFIRAWAHNSEGYDYGDEVVFVTLNDPVAKATEYLLPSSNGDLNEMELDSESGFTESWLCARIADATYNAGEGTYGTFHGNFLDCGVTYLYLRSIFNFPAVGYRSDTVVKVILRHRRGRNAYLGPDFKRLIKMGGVLYDSEYYEMLPDLHYYYEVFRTSPATSAAWTLAELDAIQAGGGITDGIYQWGVMDWVALKVCWVDAAVRTDEGQGLPGTDVRLNGTVLQDEDETCQVYFEWGETDAYGNTTSAQSKTIGQTFSDDVDIGALTSIHFRTVIETPYGETFYGEDRQFPISGAGGNNPNILVAGAYI